MMGRALTEHMDVSLALKPLAQFPNEPRLANPRLACKQHHLALAVARLPPAAQQQRDLLLQADERRKPLAVQRLEPAFGPPLAFDSPDGKRLGEAFQALRSEVGQLEQAADQSARRVADHYRVR